MSTRSKTQLGASIFFGMWMLSGQPAIGQLSNQLKSESPAQLARDAREKGDAIRGAILFPQESLGCTKCHVEAGHDLLGPDLTRIAKDRTDEFLVESILNPSKAINEGFQTTRVLTVAGKIHSGRLLPEVNGRVILRENTDEQQRLKIDPEDIEEIVSSSTSLMPDGLADQLKNRQQFLDLVRYLMELRDTEDSTSQAVTLQRSELDANLQGLVLIDRFQCGNCHNNTLGSPLIQPQSAPQLTHLVGMLDPRYIEKFIAEPSHMKPGTRMPNVLTSLHLEERRVVARQITHYLASKSNSRFDIPVIDSSAADRGKLLFHSIGCVACHSPHDDQGVPLLEESSVPLGQLCYSLDGLVRFLEDPHAVRPSGRMPNMKLDHWEAVDLANYLLSLSTQRAETDFQLDQELVQVGERKFNQYKCSICHDESDAWPRSPTQSSLPSLAEVRTSEGCLSNAIGDWPQFAIRDSEVDLMRGAILHFRGDALSNEQRIQFSMAALRCTSCHQRGTMGGVSDERTDYFETTNPNLGPQGRIPPTLTGVGSKLRSKWMREVLVSGRAIRPYVKTRMPQYSAESVSQLLESFQHSDQLPAVDYPVVEGRDQQKRMREAGFELVSESGLNCIACHTFQLKPAMTMPAVDLTEMYERLKPEWFYHYLLEPKRFHRGTVMPAFWPGGRSVRNEILDGDTHQQIAAIWEWLKEGRQARTPRGLIREPMELLATDEAVMLRRSYPGIGKRGIGVGYPQQVNLAFDAEQMRLALLWRGKFADPSGVWRGQGHGKVRPLARESVQFRTGSELDDRENPWEVDDGRPPRHQFKGYVLDELRRPTFLYRFEQVTIEDYSVDLQEARGAPRIRRTITLTSKEGRNALAFYIAPQDPITKHSPGEFQIGNAMQIHIRTSHAGTVLETPEGGRIKIPIEVDSSQPTQLILEYEWQSEARQ